MGGCQENLFAVLTKNYNSLCIHKKNQTRPQQHNTCAHILYTQIQLFLWYLFKMLVSEVYIQIQSSLQVVKNIEPPSLVQKLSTAQNFQTPRPRTLLNGCSLCCHVQVKWSSTVNLSEIIRGRTWMKCDRNKYILPAKWWGQLQLAEGDPNGLKIPKMRFNTAGHPHH